MYVAKVMELNIVKHSVGPSHLLRCEVTRPLCDSMLCIKSKYTSSIFLVNKKGDSSVNASNWRKKKRQAHFVTHFKNLYC